MCFIMIDAAVVLFFGSIKNNKINYNQSELWVKKNVRDDNALNFGSKIVNFEEVAGMC